MVKNDASLSKIKDLEKVKPESSYFPDAGKKKRTFKLESVLQAIDAMNTYLQKKHLEAQALQIAENKRAALEEKNNERIYHHSQEAESQLSNLCAEPPVYTPNDGAPLQRPNFLERYYGSPVCSSGIHEGICVGRCVGHENQDLDDHIEATEIFLRRLQARKKEFSAQFANVMRHYQALQRGVVPTYTRFD